MIKNISKEEILRQKEIINKIREENGGKEKFAVVTTLGCVQNENDSEHIKGMLCDMGYTIINDVKKADIVLFNTCAVRENAEKKVYGYIGALKPEKDKRPDMIIGMCGCMMQQPHVVERIKSTYKHVDMVFGTHSIHRFPQILYSAMRKRTFDIEDVDGYIAEDNTMKRTSNVIASVSVMYGCNNFCSYCIVPYVRGRERSRKHTDILAEVEGLAAQGYKEISLVGQNVNSYGKDCGEIDFADLLNLVSEVNGIERIRFVSAHPKDATEKLLHTIADNPKICNQIHLPFQSGSSKVLKDMNRHYTKEQYLDLIKRVKEIIPDVAISADIIVGFPTETNEDFEETLDVVKQVGFDMLFTFIYSKRKGTPAAEMDFVLTEDEIKANFERLLQTHAEILHDRNMKYQDKTIKVLVEGASRTNSEVLTGRTESGKIVNFTGSKNDIGKIIDVKITRAATFALTGEAIKEC